jgi:predicted transcriptional regulator of viral defense system
MKSQKVSTKLKKIFSTSNLVSRNILLTEFAPSTIHHMVQQGTIERVGRGLYTLGNYSGFSEYFDWALICQRMPKGVVCLLSSLRFHEIGLQNPQTLWIALPAGYHAPAVKYPPLTIIRPTQSTHSQGVQLITVDGLPIKIYCIEKTIADCFKYRNKIGIETGVEALKDAWNKKKIDLNTLWKYAKIDRVTKIIQPYLDSLQ